MIFMTESDRNLSTDLSFELIRGTDVSEVQNQAKSVIILRLLQNPSSEEYIICKFQSSDSLLNLGSLNWFPISVVEHLYYIPCKPKIAPDLPEFRHNLCFANVS